MNDKIYTKTGDNGWTRSLGEQAVRKSDALMEALGTLDELNSHVGSCLAAVGHHDSIDQTLRGVQTDLLAIGSMLAAGGGAKIGAVRIEAESVDRLEAAIDAASRRVPPLTQFVTPGGVELASRLHITRTVCRRSERRIVAAGDGGADVPPVVLQYLNRLSDLLFTLARLANESAGTAERRWER